VEVACEYGASGSKVNEGEVKMHRLDAAQPDPAKIRYFHDLAQQIDQTRVSLNFFLNFESAQVNAGKNYFLETLRGKRPDLGDDVLGPRASSGPAHIGDNAVGAVGVASILQFDKRARLASGLRHRRQQTAARSIDRGMEDLTRRILPPVVQYFRQPFFVGVAHNIIYPGNCRQGCRIPLGVTSRYDQACRRILAAQPPDCLANLLIRPVRDRARVHNNDVGMEGVFDFGHGAAAETFADRCAIRLVAAATECPD
jgi:hypothetical protein